MRGKFSFDRAEFQREIFDSISNPDNRMVVINAASQTCKSISILSGIAYMVVEDPSPCLIVNSTGSLTEFFSKHRLSPMFETNPILKGILKDKRKRDANNTIKLKEFNGGFLKLGTAGSVTDLSSVAVKYLFLDECSRYSETAEGSSIDLAIKRTTTFHDSKVLMVSSPAEEGFCQITDYLNQSTHNKYYVPCPFCDHPQILQWSNVKWTEHDHLTAHYHCPECDNPWSEQEKNQAVKNGHWQPQFPERKIIGFDISALYSSFITIQDLTAEFLQATADKESTDKLKVFINTRLGEVWRNKSASADSIIWEDRVEPYFDLDNINNDILLVTSGIDTQKDRLEFSTYGWGVDDESWLLEHVIFNGSPEDPGVWLELESYLTKKYTREDNVSLPIYATCIDSGGHHSNQVYRFCKKHQKKRVYAIKGASSAVAPIWPAQASKGKGNFKMYSVGSSNAKIRFYHQLTIDEHGPGFCHYPEYLLESETFFDQLTAKKYKEAHKNGTLTRTWFTPPGKRAETLDCRVYAMCARESIKINLKHREKRLKNQAESIAEKLKDDITVEEAQAQIKKPKRRKRKAGGSSSWSNFSTF